MSKKSESTSRGDSLDAAMTSLKVAVRVRPLNDKEIHLGSKIVVDVLGNDIVITDLKVPEHQGYDHRSRVHRFSFDYGFSSVDPESEQYASQATIFENFGRVVLQALLEGYNCCVIAYGQSGSGKTYTMMGMKDEEGLTPRICEGLLMKLEDEAKQNVSFAVNISYMEIYNEQVYDLLQKPDDCTSHSKSKLRVREHPVHGPFVEGLSTHVLKSRDNVCQLISEGNDNRVKAATYIHERSSRSHAIFTVHCSQACLDESQPKEVVSKLQLVDLAGSEKAGQEFCQSRLQEGANINKSLVTLGNVIAALVELSQCLQNGSSKGGRQLFVPYRDSQLTWLMKDSLGGNSHTFMLAAVSPSKECYSETLSTLRYAQRAKNVLTVPVVNEDPATKIIRNLRLEVNKLKSLLINADVLSKRAVMKPLPNISHLKSIMKNSEKQVDHLTRCWFKKWLETYNTVIKKTSGLNEEPQNAKKGAADILHKQGIVSGLATERMETMLCDSSTNSGIGTTPVNSLSLKVEDSDAILSDKSSSVSSECIILPNEIIFYSKGKKDHKHKNYFEDCRSICKNSTSSHVEDANDEIIISANKGVKSSSSPTVQLPYRSANDVSLCNTSFKSLPVLNYLPAFASSVHNSFFIHDPLFRFLSLPKDIQTLQESVKITEETAKVDLDSEMHNNAIKSCFEPKCERTKICESDEVILLNVGHCQDHSINGRDPEVSSNLNVGEFLGQNVRNDELKDCTSIFDIDAPTQTDNESPYASRVSHDNHCTNALSAVGNFTNCEIITNGEMHSCEEIQFNDSVAEESNNFVKMLNRVQDGSVEVINHCFQRKDSEILSLLSLSSNDYPPFYSLGDFLDDDDDDDIEVRDETGRVNFDLLSESKEQSIKKSWDDIYSSPDVTDGSESSDAESEFDYLDFTKNAAETCPNIDICNDSFASTAVNGYQNFQESKFLRQSINCKENLISIPENTDDLQELTSSDASVVNSVKVCNQAESECISMNSTSITATARSDMKFQPRHSASTVETSREQSILCSNTESQHNYTLPLPLSKGLDISRRVKVNTSEQRNCQNYISGSDEVECGAKILDNRREKSFTSHLWKDSVLQKRLCNSDSILKASPNNEMKSCFKSDNSVYVAFKECLLPQNDSDGSKENENDINHESHKKMLVTSKDSVSDFLDFSVQDIFNMINNKGGAQFKKQICSDSEDEKLQYDSDILEEIQKIIDSTEITDATKLAGELLNKKISQSPIPCAATSSDSFPSNQKEDNKLSLKSKFHSLGSDTDSKSYMSYCGEESKQKDLETVLFESDIVVLHPQDRHEQKLLNTEKEVSDTEQNITQDNVLRKINDVSHAEETGVENRNFDLLKNVHTAIEQVYCEKENALEYFTLNECSLDPMSDESYYVGNATDLMSETKKSSEFQQINSDDCSRSVAKETVPPEYSPVLDTMLFSSSFYSSATESENGNVNDSSSQTNHVFTDYNSFGNLNITSLTPIQEEAAVDGDVISDASEDDSPNISFQFDSLERPKNALPDKKCFTCADQFNRTDASTNDALNTGKLQELEKLTNKLCDVPKTFDNKNSNISTMPCTRTQKPDKKEVLHNLDFNYVKCIKKSNECLNTESRLNFSPELGFEESSAKSAGDKSCESTNQLNFQDSQNDEQLARSKNCDMRIIQDEETYQNKSFKNNLDLKIRRFEETNNLPNQLCSWDSSSSSSSSDSITFVFVGKENRDVTLDANSRSFQSSLFSSVSLDSLEKSSVHQNQTTCISPRTLSIDSLVAEELLFQLRNSDPIQPLASEGRQYSNSKCEMNNSTRADEKFTTKKTNFAATSQLNCNQHLKMYHHAHYNDLENDIFSQDVATGVLEIEKCKGQNTNCAFDRNQTISFHDSTFPSEGFSENKSDNQLQNLNENCSHISTESNGDTSMPSCNYLKVAASSKHKTDKNALCSISDPSIKENLAEVSSMTAVQNHVLENKNIFNTGAGAVSQFECINFGSHCALDLQSNNSSVVFNDSSITASNKNMRHSDVNNCNDIQKQVYLPENISSKEDRFCDKCAKSDPDNELSPVKELTEENLKIFNSEYEENRGEIFILPPPSTFDVSEDNGLSMISNSSSFSLLHDPSKATSNVFSKSTQTDQTAQSECSRSCGKNIVDDSGSNDLIMRMMDLMVETLKLMKEQYSRTPRKSANQTKRKLHFSSDSDQDGTNQKQGAITMPAINNHEKYLTKERSMGNRVIDYMQSVLPVSNECDYVTRDSNYLLSHSELLPFSQKNANENFLNMKHMANHNDPRICCSTAKKPNFYTLPFDFITCKYQGKNLPSSSKFRKADAISQTSVDYLPGQAGRSNFLSNNEFNNLSAFNSVIATEHKLSSSKLRNSKNHLKQLIEMRRKVVESTLGSLKENEDVNFENQVTDPLKSPSSSSEGYLSSVSSRGPFRQLSEVSTDSQESSHTTEHLFSKQCFLKHSVRPLDFRRQCYRDIAASPDTRWLNTSADSGAFFLDSPGTEKKTNLDGYPNITSNGNDLIGTVSSAACSSSKMIETERSILRDNDNFANSTSPKQKNVPLSSRLSPWNETKCGSRQHRGNNFALGFQDLDKIGENYLDIPSRKSVSVNSSTSSDLSLYAKRPSRNRSSASSKMSKNSSRLKRLSSQEIQKLLESIESDRRLLSQIQQNHVFDKKYSPSSILPSTSSFESMDDLFYQDCYKSLPSPRVCLSPTVSHKV